MKVLKDIFTPETRNWIYGVVVALLGLLAVFGWVTNDVADKIIILVMAILGMAQGALAKANVTIVDKTAEYKG